VLAEKNALLVHGCSSSSSLAGWLEENQVVPHVLLRADHARLSRAEQGKVPLPGMLLDLKLVPPSVGQVKQIAPAVSRHPTEEDLDGSAQDDRCRLDSVGSGIAEAACKTVVSMRAKRAGMCWMSDGLDALLALRTAVLNDTYDSFCEQQSLLVA